MQCCYPLCHAEQTHYVGWQTPSMKTVAYYYGCETHAAAFARKRDAARELVVHAALVAATRSAS